MTIYLYNYIYQRYKNHKTIQRSGYLKIEFTTNCLILSRIINITCFKFESVNSFVLPFFE